MEYKPTNETMKKKEKQNNDFYNIVPSLKNCIEIYPHKNIQFIAWINKIKLFSYRLGTQ